ncbi:glycosyltransferase family 2 protein [Microbacterium sp. MMO-10]|uniref:glycosyltransferase family 2 protein n=1 Tax=Microbacterium sp. MMO-10 TaxID=3081272 RepID=UPI003016F4DE
MVKNEADIISSVIEHNFAQGLDRLLIVDNGSTDGTLALLHDLARRFPIDIGTDSEVGYLQEHKMTALAAHVRRAGADWVVPFDADEFWFAPGTTVAEFIRATDGTQVEAQMFNIFPTEQKSAIADLSGPIRFDLHPHKLPKTAARSHPLLWVEAGNHGVVRPGLISGGLKIIHAPWRNEDQLIRKLRQGARAFAETDVAKTGRHQTHWTSLGGAEEETLRNAWSRLLVGQPSPLLGWNPAGPFLSLDPAPWRTWDPDHVTGT